MNDKLVLTWEDGSVEEISVYIWSIQGDVLQYTEHSGSNATWHHIPIARLRKWESRR